MLIGRLEILRMGEVVCSCDVRIGRRGETSECEEGHVMVMIIMRLM